MAAGYFALDRKERRVLDREQITAFLAEILIDTLGAQFIIAINRGQEGLFLCAFQLEVFR